MAAGALTAAVGLDLTIATVTGPPVRVAGVLGLALAAGAAVKLTRGPSAGAVRKRRGGPAEGIVDCTGQRLGIGDTVRAGAGFDGPMELGFGRGVVVKVGRGKAHVRFNDIPEQVHPVTPGTLRRLA
jgi:hypothetical protein